MPSPVEAALDEPPPSEDQALPDPPATELPALEEPLLEPEADDDPTETEPEPEPDAVAVALGDVAIKLSELTALDERRMAVIERLHAENQKLKRGELAAAMRPLLLDVARLHDDVSQLAKRYAGSDVPLGFLREALLDVLERQGVTAIDPAPGDPFEPKRHQSTRMVPVSDPSLDGTVAAVQRLGFVRDDTDVVRPVQVEVNRHMPDAGADPTPSSDVPDTTSNDSVRNA